MPPGDALEHSMTGKPVPAAKAELEALIALSRRLAEVARSGRTEDLESLLQERAALVGALAREPARRRHSTLYETLCREDERALQELTRWRERARRDLAGLGAARNALASYKRLAERSDNLFDLAL